MGTHALTCKFTEVISNVVSSVSLMSVSESVLESVSESVSESVTESMFTSVSSPNMTHLSCVCFSRNCLTVGRSETDKSMKRS